MIIIALSIIVIFLVKKYINNARMQPVFHPAEKAPAKKSNFKPITSAKNPSTTAEPSSICNSSQSSSLNESQDSKKYHKRQPWRKYLTIFAILTKLHHLIAFRQGKYLDSMIKLFEEGKLDDALKHAIPVSHDRHGGGQQSFGIPKPRSKLTLSEKIYGEGGTLYVDPQIQYRLKQLYRKSFEQLAKENRIEEATFVLVELLDNVNEGVEYLEKNKRYQQALDIAIARDADPDLIVRLCCLTEQWDKAIMIAKRNNAFANAVMLLEKSNKPMADKLRLIWADTLAERGEWLEAIEAIWPIKQARHIAEKWFDHAEKTEEFNANIIVKKLILQPEAINQYKQLIAELQTSRERYPERLALASAILKHKQDIVKLKTLLLSLINVMVFDISQHTTAFNKADLIELINLTQDKALLADLSINQLKVKTQQSLKDYKNLQLIGCSELGNRVIYDAVKIRNGHYLLALGEAGIIIVDKTGKQLKHYMIATHAIVLSHNRNQILALAKKEDNYHVYKLDLASEKSFSLGYLTFDMCLWDFDGINWTVIANNNIQVISVEQSLNIVWQIDIGKYTVLQASSSQANEKWLLKTPYGKYELWNYVLPTRRLTSRDEIELGVDNILINHIWGNYYFYYSESQQAILFKRSWWSEYCSLPLTISESQFNQLHALTINDFVVFLIPKEDDSGFNIHVYHPDSQMIKITIEWMNSDNIATKTFEDCVIFWDKNGRCGKLDVQKNEMIYFTV